MGANGRPFRPRRPQIFAQVPASLAIQPIYCPAPNNRGIGMGKTCEHILFVGQITGIIQIACPRCHYIIQIQPVSGDLLAEDGRGEMTLAAAGGAV
jgi:hypothetical protein